MTALLAFAGAVAGSLVGVVGGIYLEKFRAKRQLQLAIRSDIKGMLFEMNRHASTIGWSIIERRVFEMGNDEAELPGAVVRETQELLFHSFDLRVFLGPNSEPWQRVGELWDVVGAWCEDPSDTEQSQAVVTAAERVSDALAAELRRL